MVQKEIFAPCASIKAHERNALLFPLVLKELMPSLGRRKKQA